MERFTVTRVSNKDLGRYHNEIAVNVNELNNMRRNSRTVPNYSEGRKFSLAQLTRFVSALNLISDNFSINRDVTTNFMRNLMKINLSYLTFIYGQDD